jgi:hypothetical protein
MAGPRQHHYVPAFFLGGFTGSGTVDDHLWVFDKTQDGKRYRGRPGEVGKARDYNAIDVEDTNPNAVEVMLAEIEGRAAPVIAAIRSSRRMPDGRAFELLMGFVAFLAVRIPGQRETIATFMEQIGKQIIRMVVDNRDRYEASLARIRDDGVEFPDISYEQMREFVERDEYTIRTATTFQVAMMLDAAPALVPMLANRRWSVFCVNTGEGELVCSDRPVSLTWTDGRERGFYSPGYGLPETDITVPIDRHICVMGRFEGGSMCGPIDRRGVAAINTRTIMNASRVYSSREDFVWLHRDGRVCDAKELARCLRDERDEND